MQHGILFKRPGLYVFAPVPRLLPDGRLAVMTMHSPFADHFGLDQRSVLVSTDQGETFQESEDPTIPFAWPASNVRECYDRFADVMPDGSYLAAGTVGFEVWPKARRGETKELCLAVKDHPNGEEVVVGMPKVFVQRSLDQGRTWTRREWHVPGFSWLTGFPRWVRLADGSILLPIYGRNKDGSRAQTFVFRSDRRGEDWRLIPMASSISSVFSDEMGLIEVAPGRVLALIRHAAPGQLTEGYLLESWSEDGGRSWSQPLGTAIQGFPPHLLRLQDGRLLCGVTYRWRPMGIHAVLSNDNGRTWDSANTIVLRNDGGAISTLWPQGPGIEPRRGGSDIGYPITVQFPDGLLFTCYWITGQDGITHAAYTRWRLE
jgi:hypothetical protein